jgi:hypothetical protein
MLQDVAGSTHVPRYRDSHLARRALGTPLPLLDSASGFFLLDAFIATQMTEGV